MFLHDLAFQRHVFERAGLGIRNCYLMHVNNAYVRLGAIDPDGFFLKIDVTTEVAKLLPSVPLQAGKMLQLIELAKCPHIKISPHCDEPYECALKPLCWSFLPLPNVFDLRYGAKKSWDLFDRGVLRIENIPEDFALTGNQSRQVAAHRSQTQHIDRQAIRTFLEELWYPFIFWILKQSRQLFLSLNVRSHMAKFHSNFHCTYRRLRQRNRSTSDFLLTDWPIRVLCF